MRCTLNDIAPCKQPLIGGMDLEHSARVFFRDTSSLISHCGAVMLTPFDLSSCIRTVAAPVFAPDLDRMMMCLAFLRVIQRAALRPRPPKPPVIIYAAFSSKYHDEWELGRI